MKRLIIISLFFLFILSIPCLGNIRAINYRDIPDFDKMQKYYDYIFNNEFLYQNYTPEWKYDVDKKEVIGNLVSILKELEKYENKNPKNVDLRLLEGDICHFLYNLDETKYGKQAEKYYADAANISKEDFRPQWFLAHHYVLSLRLAESYNLYRDILNSIDHKNMPEEFINDYCYASVLLTMPSSAMWGFSKFRQITGKTSYVEKQAGEHVKSLLVKVSNSDVIETSKQWMAFDSNMVFLNRLFGMRITICKDWKIIPQDNKLGKTNSSGVFILPPMEKGKKGNLGYTIAVISKIPEKGETFQKFIDSSIGSFSSESERSDFEVNDVKYVAYKIKKTDVYPDEGGAKVRLLFVERNEPEFPGMIIEHPIIPIKDKSSDSKGVSYFRMNPQYTRYQGKLFYLIILDTADSIFDKSDKVFMRFLDEQFIIE